MHVWFPGRWHCVKRTLSECGNYDLESYLPVFLWKQAMERKKKNCFWELMRLLQKHPNLLCNNIDDDIEFSEEVNLLELIEVVLSIISYWY